jgi:hypothetical protein
MKEQGTLQNSRIVKESYISMMLTNSMDHPYTGIMPKMAKKILASILRILIKAI